MYNATVQSQLQTNVYLLILTCTVKHREENKAKQNKEKKNHPQKTTNVTLYCPYS